MQITITSTLTEEQALILAKEKGYSELVYTIVPNESTNGIIIAPIESIASPNPQSSFDFLKAVYENMIKEDAKRLFIAYDDRLNIDKKLAREQLLKDMVDAAFVL
jgi:hypothetical protein